VKKYKVLFQSHVFQVLSHLHPYLKTKIRIALDCLSLDPRIGKLLNLPLKNYWSYRVADFRIVYRIHESEIFIEVVEIAERKIVYENVLKLIREK